MSSCLCCTSVGPLLQVTSQTIKPFRLPNVIFFFFLFFFFLFLFFRLFFLPFFCLLSFYSTDFRAVTGCENSKVRSSSCRCDYAVNTRTFKCQLQRKLVISMRGMSSVAVSWAHSNCNVGSEPMFSIAKGSTDRDVSVSRVHYLPQQSNPLVRPLHLFNPLTLLPCPKFCSGLYDRRTFRLALSFSANERVRLSYDEVFGRTTSQYAGERG